MFLRCQRTIVSIMLPLFFTGCASIVSGQQQPVTVSTGSINGASCILENNKGSWDIPSTPGQISVHRSMDSLYVECKKKGYGRAHKTVPSAVKTIAFGNILFGGIIGGAVDTASGAAFDYPAEIRINMDRAAA